VTAVAKRLKMTEEGRNAFRDYIHAEKNNYELGNAGRGDRTFQELLELGKKFLEENPQFRR
jgi:hypothetical protein